jgi:hypothetical protein
VRLPGSWRALTEGSLFSRARGALGSCIVLHMVSPFLSFSLDPGWQPFGCCCTGQCLPCLNGSYALDGANAACTPCPAGAVCPGRNVLLPDTGYWQAQRCSNNQSSGAITNDACKRVDKCDSGKACRGSLQTLSKGRSALGNETELSKLVFDVCKNTNTTPLFNLSLAALNDPNKVCREAFLQAQCSEGYAVLGGGCAIGPGQRWSAASCGFCAGIRGGCATRAPPDGRAATKPIA